MSTEYEDETQFWNAELPSHVSYGIMGCAIIKYGKDSE